MNTGVTSGKWRLEGYDAFEGGLYPIPGEHDSEVQAEEAARVKLAEIEETQPSDSSGGQSEDGIQDHIYIVSPDGKKSRFTG